MSGTDVYQTLRDRGFVYQCTDEEGLPSLMNGKSCRFYIGFDPTSDSLHAGSLVPVMAMMHMQSAGHTPIAIVGGGTAMVGDPSGKTETRKMLTREKIQENGLALKSQLSRYVRFDDGSALLADNADWLEPLRYIEFLRDIGRHFSVNRMLAYESVKQRLEVGLSFIEFNYMLLQAYDFLVLARDHGCLIQMGGQDQWGNITAGIDLVRRKLNAQAFGLTFPLLTNASGEKFGKTVAGAVWLDESKTPVFDYYQFWRNTEDADVRRFLGLFTLLPVEEADRLGSLRPPLINRSKEILAYEATRITHGKDKADQACKSAMGQFGCADPDGAVPTSSEILHLADSSGEIVPSTAIPLSLLKQGVDLVSALVDVGIAASKGEARRLVAQGGVTVNGARVSSVPHTLSDSDVRGGTILIRAGKKRLHRILAE